MLVMTFGYFIFAVFCLLCIRGIIKLVKEKDVIGLLSCVFCLLFSYGLFIGFIFGGSALHNASNDYELYQSGHYYLMSHGIWTEVSYGTYLFILISEIIGFLSFIPCVVLSIISIVRQRSNDKNM